MASIELTAEMKECLKAQRIVPLATASKDGVPNVVPIGMIFPVISSENLLSGIGSGSNAVDVGDADLDEALGRSRLHHGALC